MVLLEGDLLHYRMVPVCSLVTDITSFSFCDFIVAEVTISCTRVCEHFVTEPHVLGEADLVRKSRRKTEGQSVGVTYARLCYRTFLGCDEDDTVTCSHTINGSGSVLKDRDAFDVLRVQLGKDSGA